MELDDLTALSSAYTAHIGCSEATVSNKVTSHARLFDRIRAGKGCNFLTFKVAVRWFDEHWPADLEWPKGIERPSRARNTRGAA